VYTGVYTHPISVQSYINTLPWLKCVSVVDLQPGLLYLSAVSADPEVKVIRQLLAVGIRFVSLQQPHKRSIIQIHACIGLVSQLKAKTTGISILNHSCTCMATIDRCKGRHGSRYNCETMQLTRIIIGLLLLSLIKDVKTLLGFKLTYRPRYIH